MNFYFTRIRQIIRCRVTAILWRPQVKQDIFSNDRGIVQNLIGHNVILKKVCNGAPDGRFRKFLKLETCLYDSTPNFTHKHIQWRTERLNINVLANEPSKRRKYLNIKICQFQLFRAAISYDGFCVACIHLTANQ